MAFCVNCGNELKDGANFCPKCGFSTTGKKDTSTNNKKIIIPIAIGLIVLALIGGGWYGYKEYSAYSESKQAHEKFIADSLEQVRKDSIRLAEQKEKERIEAEELAKFQEQLSFENFLGMLKHYENQSYANKCGFNLIYRVDTEEEYGTDTEIVYGYDVEKGSKNGYGYDIIAKSNHACYFTYALSTSTGARLYFKNEEDANLLYKKAKEYGLIFFGDGYFIPNKRLPNGKSIRLEESDNINEWAWASISAPDYSNGWYVIYLSLDF